MHVTRYRGNLKLASIGKAATQTTPHAKVPLACVVHTAAPRGTEVFSCNTEFACSVALVCCQHWVLLASVSLLLGEYHGGKDSICFLLS